MAVCGAAAADDESWNEDILWQAESGMDESATQPDEAALDEVPAGTHTQITLRNLEFEDSSGGFTRNTRYGDQLALNLDIAIPYARDAIDALASLRIRDKHLDAGMALTPREAAFTLSGVSSNVRMLNGYLREGFEALGIPGDGLPRAASPERLLGLMAMNDASFPRALLDHFAITYVPIVSEKVWPWWITKTGENAMNIEIPSGSALPILKEIIAELNGDVSLSRVLGSLLWFEPLPVDGNFVSGIQWPDRYSLPEGITLMILSEGDVAVEAMLSATVRDLDSGVLAYVVAQLRARENEGEVSLTIMPKEIPLGADYPAWGDFKLTWNTVSELPESGGSHTVCFGNFRDEAGTINNFSFTRELGGVYEVTEPEDEEDVLLETDESEADWTAVNTPPPMTLVDNQWKESVSLLLTRDNDAEEVLSAVEMEYEGGLWYDQRSETYERSGQVRLSDGDYTNAQKDWVYTADLAAVSAPGDQPLDRPLLIDTNVHTDREGARAAGDQARATFEALLGVLETMGLFPDN